jgi:hypothetical protein
MKFFKIKWVIIVLVMLCSSTLSFSQTTKKKNAVSFELGKTGMIFNLAYDRMLSDRVGLRASVGSNFTRYLGAITSGAGAFYLIGKNKHTLELGANLNYLEVNEVSDDQRSGTIIFPDHTIKTWHANMNVGYRMYGAKSIFRVGVSPGFIKEGFIPGAYIGYGLVF